MTSSNNKTTSKIRPVMAPRAHGRWYILATVSLAVFLIAVAVWQRPPKSHTAKIVVTQVGRHGQLDDRDAIIGAVFELHQKHAHTGDASHDHDHGHGHTHLDEQSDHSGSSQPHLLVDVTTIASEKQISIWCATPQAKSAMAEARLLADAYVALVNEPGVPAESSELTAKAKIELDEAKRKHEEAQQQLAAFQQEHAKQLQPANASEANEELPPVEPSPPPVVAQPNPRWVEIQQRVAVLRAARDQLLQERTESHPQVRDLQWQVEKLEAELKVVAKSIVSDVPKVQPTVVETVVSKPAPELLNRLQELEAAVFATEQQYLNAQSRWEATAKVQAPKSMAIAAVSGPARVVSSQGAGASFAGVFGGALIALLLGAVIAARALVVCEPSTLVSLQRVELLGVPITAALATGDGPAFSQADAVNPTWIAWLTFTCEILIGGVALLLLLSACADWQFAAHLLRDPLSALTDAANRLW